MTTVIQGADRILFIGEKVTDGEAAIDGARLSLQTTHNITESSDDDSTVTKDGNVSTPAPVKTEMSIENLESDDPTNDYLKKSLEKKVTIPIWEVDFTKVGTDDANKDKYPARYLQARVNQIEWDNDADDNSTQKVDLTVDGVPQDGYVSIDKSVTSALQYAFRDLNAKSDGSTTPPPDSSSPASGTTGSTSDTSGS